MNRRCAFTIVAKNYIGLGQILGKSISVYDNDIDFYIIVVDEFSSQEIRVPSNVLLAKDCLGISPSKWVNMTFKYDLTEFCTSVKPFSFRYFFCAGYESVIYFDPDIFVYSSLNTIFDELGNRSVMLVPHIADIHVNYDGELPEWAIMSNGIYNLGFCAMNNTLSSKLLVDWWCKRLEDSCFSDRAKGFFTDQKWMDWIPGFLGDDCKISQNLGFNMAPWNYFERKIEEIDGEYYVAHRIENKTTLDKLVFIHFAGYDYTAFKNGEIKRKRIEGLNDYPDLYRVQSDYRDAIVAAKDTFDSFINQKYSYNTFENGDVINSFHRRIYDGLIQDGEVIDNPYNCGKGSMYERLKKAHMIKQNGNFEKLNSRNISNLQGKKNMIALLFKLLFFFGGYKRYTLFTKAIIEYYRPQNHTFLLK